MSSPDDDNKTLGLPPGARSKMLQEIEREKQAAARRAAQQAGGRDIPPPPPAAPPAPPSAQRRPTPVPPAADPSRDAFETIPPVGGLRPRELPGLKDRKEGRAPEDIHPPLQPWDEGSTAKPTPAEPGSFHSGWSMPGTPAAPPSPWDDDGERFDTAPPPPPKKTARDDAPRPSRGAPPPVRPPWPGGPDESPAGVLAPDSAESSTPFSGTGFPPEIPSPPPIAASPPIASRPRPAAARAPVEDGSNRTIGIGLLPSGARPSFLTLQFFNTSVGRWSDLGKVGDAPREIGRSTFKEWSANAEDLAARHVRLAAEADGVYVEPLPSLNGVYLKLRARRPVELAPRSRFRIGHHVLEYRPGAPIGEIDAKRSEDGEAFRPRVLSPLGFIDLIGPDDEAYLSYPLTKPDEPGARIGRGGPGCDLALSGDDWASSSHARVYFSGGACRLEDLGSTNGTFLQILEPVKLECGDPQRRDSGDVVVIGGYMLRVVEERP
jgi:pSer/pThr/pTyr-binding forkhead associated (FHA) protein